MSAPSAVPAPLLKYYFGFQSPLVDLSNKIGTHARFTKVFRTICPDRRMKVYINHDARLYIEDRNCYEDIRKSLSINNEFSVLVGDLLECFYTRSTQNNLGTESEEIDGVATVKYDLFGNQIAVIDGDDGSSYVSIQDIESTGFKLYNTNVATLGITEQLKGYLHMQAAFFIQTSKLNLPKHIVTSVVNEVVDECKMSDLLCESSKSSTNGSAIVSNMGVCLPIGDDLQIVVVKIETKNDRVLWIVNKEEESFSSSSLKLNEFIAYKHQDKWVGGELVSLNPLRILSFYKKHQIDVPIGVHDNLNHLVRVTIDHRHSSMEQQIKFQDEFTVKVKKQFSDGTYMVQIKSSIQQSEEASPKPKWNNKFSTDSTDRLSSDNEDKQPARTRETKPNSSSPLKTNTNEKTEPSVENINVSNGIGTKTTPHSHSASMLKKMQKLRKPAAQSAPKVDPYSNMKFIGDIFDGQEGTVECLQVLGDSNFMGYFTCARFVDEAIELEEIIVKDETPCVATTDDIVAIKEPNEESFVRGLVLEKKDNVYKVAKIDYGEVVSVKDVFTLEKRYLEIPVFVAVCQPPTGFVAVIGEAYDFVSKSPNKFIVTDITMECKRWMPPKEEVSNESEKKHRQRVVTSLPEVKQQLQINDDVMIVHVDDENVYLRNRQMKTIVCDIANQKIEECVPLEKPAVVDQLVLVKPDKDWRRARVIEFVNNDRVLVEFIDYKTTVELGTSDLFYIGDELADTEAGLFAKKLRGFATLPSAIVEFLKTLLKKKLSVVYHLNGEVDLSNQIVQSVAAFARNYKTLDDLPRSVVPIDRDIPVAVFQIDQEDKFKVRFAIECIDELEDLDGYKSQPVPELLLVNQLCLALHDDGLSRAKVLKVDRDSIEAYFIDSGEKVVVKLENTRVFPNDLLKFAPVLSVGSVKDVPNIDKMVLSQEFYDAKIGKEKDGVYYFTRFTESTENH